MNVLIAFALGALFGAACAMVIYTLIFAREGRKDE